jgi:hypothetical protein
MAGKTVDTKSSLAEIKQTIDLATLTSMFKFRAKQAQFINNF